MSAKKPRFKRILLKLRGEALMGNKPYGVDPSILKTVAEEIELVHGLGVEIGIVIGGGRMGVGTDNLIEAIEEWEENEKRNYDFQDFLEDLRTRKRRPTSFEAAMPSVSFEISEGNSAINQVILQKTRVVIEEGDLAAVLPAEITRTFSLTRCAILPLRAGNQVLGVVIVDNKHNHELLRERSLDRLQNLLDSAGLVYETLQEQKKSANLLSANYEILGGASSQVLQATLSQICRTAQTGPHFNGTFQRFRIEGMGCQHGRRKAALHCLV